VQPEVKTFRKHQSMTISIRVRARAAVPNTGTLVLKDRFLVTQPNGNLHAECLVTHSALDVVHWASDVSFVA